MRVKGAGTSLSVSGGNVGGNISADDCLSVLLDKVAVGGNVQIQSCTGRSGYAGNSGLVLIHGNFRCVDDPAGCVAINGEVDGNVSLTGDDNASVEDNSVGGNVKADDNGFVLVLNNLVGGNVEALDNADTTVIIQNRISGNLTCQSGSQVFGNLVHGKTNCPEK